MSSVASAARSRPRHASTWSSLRTISSRILSRTVTLLEGSETSEEALPARDSWGIHVHGLGCVSVYE